jgi:hypothetical protein
MWTINVNIQIVRTGLPEGDSLYLVKINIKKNNYFC